MNRLDLDAKLYKESPAIFLEFPSTLILKFDRASRQRKPRNIVLTSSEASLVESLCDDPGWFNHQGKQIVFREGRIYRLC